MEARCTANTVVQPLVTVPLNQKCIVDSIFLDNRSGVAVTVQLQDNFTEDVSAGPTPIAAPTARIALPFQQTVPANQGYNADVNSLQSRYGEQGLVILEQMGAICSVIEPLCDIVVFYHFE